MQNNKDNQAKACIDQRLQGKIAADAVAGVVHRLGHELKMPVSAQLNEAIAQIFPLQQHEKGKDSDQNDRNHHTQHTADRIQPALTASNFPHRDRPIG